MVLKRLLNGNKPHLGNINTVFNLPKKWSKRLKIFSSHFAYPAPYPLNSPQLC